MLIKRFKLILGIIIPFLSIFLMSQNTFAENHASFTTYWRSYYIQGSSGVVNQENFDPNSQTLHTLLTYDINDNITTKYLKGFSVDFDVPDTTQYQHKTLVVKLTLVQYGPGDMPGEPKSTLKRDIPNVLAVNTTSGDKFVVNKCSGAYVNHQGFPTSYYVTYTCSINWDDFASLYNVQLTIGTTRNATTSSPNVGWIGPMANSAYNPQSGSIQAYWLNYELTGSTDPSYNNIVIISEGVQQMLEQENQAVNNIQNQTVSDIPNATNAQTTSLLGVISSFIGALTSIDTSGNCQLTLPFPQFVGGDTVVNPCNGKDKAPAMVQVFSSLFLIGIFVPLAWLLIRMIYKEIRTWTNG